MAQEFTYQIIRSNRRSISIEIEPDGSLTVRCPRTMPDREVRQFVESKSEWLRKHLQKYENQPKLPPFTREQIQAMADAALRIIPPRVEYYAARMGVTYGNITIRNQRTRWGSCTREGNLNFNCLLMEAPARVVDYVVVHELCHRKEMNHSAKFWAEVERVMPDYKVHRKWLKDNGNALIARMLG